MDHMHPEFGRGFAYVQFNNSKAASDAVNYMNGGQIDGQEVSVAEVFPRASRQQYSPPSRPSYRDQRHSPTKGSDHLRFVSYFSSLFYVGRNSIYI